MTPKSSYIFFLLPLAILVFNLLYEQIMFDILDFFQMLVFLLHVFELESVNEEMCFINAYMYSPQKNELSFLG